jgi:NAD(P)-dependent dehydrogenase (short-subunit alcohol dehydrogenase family)
MQALPTDGKPPVKLDQNTVFAVTGGAGAITVAIVRDLAAASRGTFYLLDARAMPPASEHALLETVVKDREAAKREVFERIKAEKGRATPAQVEEKLFDLERQAGILEALHGVEQAGGRAFYRQVDVLDGAAVKAVVDNIRAESGRIDVILHAAGLERSRSLDRKPVEEFDLVFRVKADGLFNLMAATWTSKPSLGSRQSPAVLGTQGRLTTARATTSCARRFPGGRRRVPDRWASRSTGLPGAASAWPRAEAFPRS